MKLLALGDFIPVGGFHRSANEHGRKPTVDCPPFYMLYVHPHNNTSHGYIPPLFPHIMKKRDYKKR